MQTNISLKSIIKTLQMQLPLSRRQLQQINHNGDRSYNQMLGLLQIINQKYFLDPTPTNLSTLFQVIDALKGSVQLKDGLNILVQNQMKNVKRQVLRQQKQQYSYKKYDVDKEKGESIEENKQEFQAISLQQSSELTSDPQYRYILHSIYGLFPADGSKYGNYQWKYAREGLRKWYFHNKVWLQQSKQQICEFLLSDPNLVSRWHYPRFNAFWTELYCYLIHRMLSPLTQQRHVTWLQRTHYQLQNKLVSLKKNMDLTQKIYANIALAAICPQNQYYLRQAFVQFIQSHYSTTSQAHLVIVAIFAQIARKINDQTLLELTQTHYCQILKEIKQLDQPHSSLQFDELILSHKKGNEASFLQSETGFEEQGQHSIKASI